MKFSFLQKTLFGVAVFGMGVFASLWLEESGRPEPGFAQEWSQAGLVGMPQGGTDFFELAKDLSYRPRRPETQGTAPLPKGR